MNLTREFVKGLWKEHPIFRQLLGMCPALAISTRAVNAIGMGASVIFVLVGSNIVISLLRKVTPNRVRIPIFIVVISTFVTVVDLTVHGFFPQIHKALGIFIPLIVVNCIILGRAESFAQKNSLIPAIIDGLGMGLGFTWGLLVLGSVREILGNGTWFGLQLAPEGIPTSIVMILPAGAFITLGFLLAAMNKIETYRTRKSG